jgi:hypothetical protein
MGGIASAFGVTVAILAGGVLSLVAGLVALAWWRRIEPGWTASNAAATAGAAVAPVAPAPRAA